METKNKYFMDIALKEARKGFEKNEVPVGAVLVYKDEIISKAYNQVEILKDATAHAEMICISGGFIYFNNWRLKDTVLYTTLEPCIMCAGAIVLSRVKKVVWGAKDLRVGAGGSFLDLFTSHPIHKVETEEFPVSESEFLLKQFFKKRR